MDKIIGSLVAHTFGQITQDDVLSASTAGRLPAIVGTLRNAGVRAAAFTLVGATLAMAPHAAHADDFNPAAAGVGALGGGALGSFVGGGDGRKAAILVGGATGAWAANSISNTNQQINRQNAQRAAYREAPSPYAVGPQFPTNESLAPNHNNGLAKTIGTVAGALVGGLGGSFVGGGVGRKIAIAGGGLVGAVAGRTAGDEMTSAQAVGVGEATTVKTAEYGDVLVSPAPWGNLSPFMAQVEGLSQPTRSLSTNPAAQQALAQALAQAQQMKYELNQDGAMVQGQRTNQTLAVSANQMQGARQAEVMAEKTYTDAEHMYLGVGVQALKNQLDNLALQGYDLRGYKNPVMSVLDVPVRAPLRLKAAGAYNPVIARMVMQMPTQGDSPQTPAQYQTAQVGQPIQNVGYQAAPAGNRVPGVDYSHLVKIENGKIVDAPSAAAQVPSAPTMSNRVPGVDYSHPVKIVNGQVVDATTGAALPAPTVSPAQDALNNAPGSSRLKSGM